MGDFTLTPMTIAIGEGERFGEATLSVVDDATDEDSETVAIQGRLPDRGADRRSRTDDRGQR